MFVLDAMGLAGRNEAAARVVSGIVAGSEPAATSALTIDEVVWSVIRRAGRAAALDVGQRVLSMPNLRILPVRSDDVHAALRLMGDSKRLRPRDALHAAVAMNAGIFTIVSDNKDFDAVPGLSRRPLA